MCCGIVLEGTVMLRNAFVRCMLVFTCGVVAGSIHDWRIWLPFCVAVGVVLIPGPRDRIVAGGER